MTRIRRWLMLTGLFTGLAAASAPAAGVAQELPPPCGTVMADTTLAADCLAPLTVGADDVAVDLGGHQVLCVGPGTGVEVPDRRGVRVQNGQVNNCSLAVVLSGGGGHALKHLRITSGPGAGVVIDDSDGNLVRHVRILGVRGFGLRVSGRDNQLQANELAGIVAQGGTGIVLLSGATGTQVLLNDLHDNAVGIQVGGSRNVVEANEASQNQVGINVDGSANVVQANVAEGNGLAGIAVGADGTRNRVQDNEASGSGLYDLADFPPGPCRHNRWRNNAGVTLLDGCETGRR
jgi:parallel beta-helix repeat protein